MKMIASSRQIFAARAFLRLSQQELAAAAGVARSTLVALEKGDHASNNASRELVQVTLEEKGIEFLADDGVKGDGIRMSKSIHHRSER